MVVAVDFLAVFILFIALVTAIRKGLVVTVYNLVSITVIIFVVLHIYPSITDLIKQRIPVLPEGFGDFLSVGVLFIGFMVIARLLRELLMFFLSAGSPGTIEKIISLFLGMGVGVLTASMFLFWLYLSPWKVVEKSITNSRFSSYLWQLPSNLYTVATDYLIKPYLNKRFSPNKLVYKKKK